MECLVKGYFQDKDRGSEALARTQYLSKTKLRNTGDDLAIDIPRMQQRSVEIGDLSVNPMWC